MSALIHEAVAESFAFGPFVLRPSQQRLEQDARPVRVGKRALELLTLLVERHGQVVSKEDLMARAWPGLVVDEGNLKVTIGALRRLLGEGAGPPRYIATVVGRGYRFVANVQGTSDGLPLSGKRIYGRDDTIDSIVGALQTTRLVSIVGPGGVGKTTVALAVANRVATAFSAGVCFVELSALSEPAQVMSALAGARRDAELLVVLDNCEHLIDAVAQGADQILTTTKKIKLVTTSREPLCIQGERVRRLGGLGLPPEQDTLRSEAALRSPAVQLFVERATAKAPAFRLDDDNAPYVAAICQRLDGLPLAIERVAPRVGSLGVSGMLEHLDRRFHMLDGYHEGPARHRTLTAAVDASYLLLSASEQTIFRQLSAFEGAFSLQSACELADPRTASEDVARLVTKSLLWAEPCDGEMRYRMPQVTRAYALAKRLELGEAIGPGVP